MVLEGQQMHNFKPAPRSGNFAVPDSRALQNNLRHTGAKSEYISHF